MGSYEAFMPEEALVGYRSWQRPYCYHFYRYRKSIGPVPPDGW